MATIRCPHCGGKIDGRAAAAMLGGKGGSKTSPRKVLSSRTNGRVMLQPCECGHGRSRHRWQRGGSRAGCKDCGCITWKEGA